MRARLSLVVILFLLGAPVAAHAQAPGEIAFWESVRDSKDPAELRAYLERYPNGAFAVLARRRLAALESGSARPSAAPPTPPAQPARTAAPEIAWTLPKAGDAWTYRLAKIRRFGDLKREPERAVVVTVTEVGADSIADQTVVDDGTPLAAKHIAGGYLINQGAAVFSPYMPALGPLPPAGALEQLRIEDPACVSRLICEAKGRVVGKELVRVPAGTFAATKIVIQHSWRATVSGPNAGTGGRILTVWYAPEMKRAVKYASRATFFGGNAPIDPDFDLELVSSKIN